MKDTPLVVKRCPLCRAWQKMKAELFDQTGRRDRQSSPIPRL
jgi:hypothetical protein